MLTSFLHATGTTGSGYNDSKNDGLGGNTTSGTGTSETGQQHHSHGLASYIPGTQANKEKKAEQAAEKGNY